jgi:TIR domain
MAETDIFISYKSERRKAAAHLAAVLKLHGYSVWFDYELIKGHDFGLQIGREIRESAPPSQPRVGGSGPRRTQFAPWTPQYRQQRSGYIDWSNIKRESQAVANSISFALGALIGREGYEPEAGR